MDGQPQRMIKHLLEQCKNVPEDVKESISQNTNTASQTSQLPSQNLQNPQFFTPNLNNQSTKKRQKTQATMDSYADKCSQEEQKEIDHYLACAIFGCGLPLSLVEDEHFI